MYLRPETAQGIFINNEYPDHQQAKTSFGVAQIGKSFRNEVSRKFYFRTREFEQMEMEYFVRPGR